MEDSEGKLRFSVMHVPSGAGNGAKEMKKLGELEKHLTSQLETSMQEMRRQLGEVKNQGEQLLRGSRQLDDEVRRRLEHTEQELKREMRLQLDGIQKQEQQPTSPSLFTLHSSLFTLHFSLFTLHSRPSPLAPRPSPLASKSLSPKTLTISPHPSNTSLSSPAQLDQMKTSLPQQTVKTLATTGASALATSVGTSAILDPEQLGAAWKYVKGEWMKRVKDWFTTHFNIYELTLIFVVALAIVVAARLYCARGADKGERFGDCFFSRRHEMRNRLHQLREYSDTDKRFQERYGRSFRSGASSADRFADRALCEEVAQAPHRPLYAHASQRRIPQRVLLQSPELRSPMVRYEEESSSEYASLGSRDWDRPQRSRVGIRIGGSPATYTPVPRRQAPLL